MADLKCRICYVIETLLARGKQGQGVAILKDGTMWALESKGDQWWASHPGEVLYRLVPLSAGVGDTDGT